MRPTFIIFGTASSLLSSFTHASPLQDRAIASVGGYSYQGCYTEATNTRALTGSAYFDDLMTLEKCAAACGAYVWFGVEFARECYCGNSLNPGSAATSETECNYQCPGNSAEICGAGNRLNVYRKPADTTTTSPTSNNYVADGCYTEATNGRALIQKRYDDDAMTIEKCAAACAGYKHFGLEYYRECYCGDTLQVGSIPASSATECDHPCGGDKTEICGGDNRLNLYTFGSSTESPTSPAASTTSATSSTSNYVFKGCYTEATNSRALTGAVFYNDAMTVELCASVCAGSAWFGIEYARECYCGNTIQAGSELTSTDECSFLCPGNNAEKCGAGNRLDMYQFGGTSPTSSSSTSISSSASTSTSSSTSTSTTSTTSSSISSTSTMSSSSLTSVMTGTSSTIPSITSDSSTSTTTSTSAASSSSITSITASTSSTSSITSTTTTTSTTTASTLAPTPITFHLSYTSRTNVVYYLYINPTTSATSRYVFHTTSVSQATRFTVNPVTGSLQDTSTGYDIYLTNTNAPIAVTQAYDAATVATLADRSGFKCAPETGDNKLICNNVNGLNSLRICGAYLYAAKPSYTTSACTVSQEVTLVAVDGT